MSIELRLTLSEIEERVCDVASEQLGLAREHVFPHLSFVEDLGCDSLDFIEFLMAIEETFAITLPDKAPNSVYKAVFTRQPFRISDLAELVYLQQGTGAPERRGWWSKPVVQPQVVQSVPFTQLDGRWREMGGKLLEPLKADGPTQQYRRRSDGMRCILIPSASVEIGSGAPDAEIGERPMHTVKL
jgi:acyl carrier protein